VTTTKHDEQRNVLIADDDHNLAFALGLRCRQLGMRVLITHDLASSQAAAQENPLHLVCVDVNLPDGSGLALCEWLASKPQSAKIPVIVLTGRKDAETIRKCGQLCAYYIHKSGDLWRRLAPVIYELVDIEPASVTR
jgi:DNA-binding response OmpR family regulator